MKVDTAAREGVTTREQDNRGKKGDGHEGIADIKGEEIDWRH